MRACYKCKIVKEWNEFHRCARSGDGFQRGCKECQKAYRNDPINKDIERRRARSEESKAYKRKYYKTPKMREKAAKRSREKRKTNPDFKLVCNIRKRVHAFFRGGNRGGSAVTALGCTINEFWTYLESKFLPGMTKENYGEWHLDHIAPLSWFDLKDPEQFKKACHYTNYQPLWATDNLSKGDKYAG
jgi:hypothetical protein